MYPRIIGLCAHECMCVCETDFWVYFDHSFKLLLRDCFPALISSLDFFRNMPCQSNCTILIIQ